MLVSHNRDQARQALRQHGSQPVGEDRTGRDIAQTVSVTDKPPKVVEGLHMNLSGQRLKAGQLK